MSDALAAFNLKSWIEANKDAFRPPVANKEVWPESEFIFQIIRGPNARNDFHIDPGDEIFYQLEGAICVDVIQPDGTRKRNRLNQGDVLLVPAGVPHSPLRPAGSWGLVVERKRHPGELDGIVWFCDRCDAELYRRQFDCTNIETEVKAAIDAFYAGDANRVCRQCGAVLAQPGDFRL